MIKEKGATGIQSIFKLHYRPLQQSIRQDLNLHLMSVNRQVFNRIVNSEVSLYYGIPFIEKAEVTNEKSNGARQCRSRTG